MKYFTKINYLILVSLFFLISCYSITNFNILFFGANKNSLHSSLAPLNKAFEIKCASGYTKIPIELNNLYLEQSKYVENIESSSNLFTKLKYGIEFYGYTYLIFDSEDSDDALNKCFGQRTNQENIKFVNKEIDNVIQMYISAVVFNEVTVFNAQVNAVENDPRQVKINQLQLCTNANCGLKNNEEYKSFTYINLADIKYARTFSDSTLFTTTRDYLIQLNDNSIEPSALTGSEITQMLTQARVIAYKRADEINK